MEGGNFFVTESRVIVSGLRPARAAALSILSRTKSNLCLNTADYYSGTTVMHELRASIEDFLQGARQPVLQEAGEELLALTGENLALSEQNGVVLLQAWDERRNLSRRVSGIETRSRSKLVLQVERFGKKHGALSLLDLARTDRQAVGLRADRQEFREVFRRLLRREFPAWTIEILSTEPDLERSLSPAYPRALLREGKAGLAAMAAPPGSDVDGVLSFALVWLDLLRQTETDLTLAGVVLFLPEGGEKNTCLRLRFLDSRLASYTALAYSVEGYTRVLDLRDYGNVDTKVEPCRRNSAHFPDALAQALTQLPGVEAVPGCDGSLSFRVRGLEFARRSTGEWRAGRKGTNPKELLALAAELTRVRSPDARLRDHPLYLKNPESWLESQVRAQLPEVDATLSGDPLYGQVPAFAAGNRGVIDLLAADSGGRLAVLELKASEDIHLPLQALDYWIRVKWHLDRGDFARHGYFPGVQIRTEAPRLLLVAPALEFHPTNERVLRFFDRQVEVARLGLGVEWQKQVKVVHRVQSHVSQSFQRHQKGHHQSQPE